jgi:[acyl-carrier-protein] S-malonyltransferase
MEMSGTPNRSGLLFPGQGAQSLGMLGGVAEHHTFKRRYAIVCDYTRSQPLVELERGNTSYLHRNHISSLLTILVSSIALDLYRERQASAPDFLAGYSVGQWTALYAAGCVDFETLAAVIARRAELMNECLDGRSGAMIGVVGLPEPAVEGLFPAIRDAGEMICISNFNGPGQYTVAGTEAGIRLFEQRAAALNPKRLVRLAVNGAWHCELMEDAARRFADVLAKIVLHEPKLPIVDNRTGDFLPVDRAERQRTLALHLSHPVRWEAGVRRLIAAGCREFVEIGYGSVLSRFGLFIDRRCAHRAFCTHEESI